MAEESNRNLCAKVTKEMGRCVTVTAPRPMQAAGSRIDASRVTVKPGNGRDSGPLAEPDCSGFLRANSCWLLDWGYQVWEVRNGVPTRVIGWQTHRFETRVGWEYYSLNWSLRTSVKTKESWGTEAAGPVPAVVDNGCARGAGTVCSTWSGGTYSVSLRSGVTHHQSWEQRESGPVSRGTLGVASLEDFVGAWMVVRPLGTPGQTVSLNAAIDNGVSGRCDSVVRLFPGCVAAENIAVIAYDSIGFPLVTEVAQHVYDAQGFLAGNPGWYGRGNPLTLGDADTAARNRAVACPPGGTPPGRSCDEYPIARANEGAASGYPYSVRYVSQEANDSQGGQTAAYIGYSRILQYEQFWIIAFLPDGRNSWDR